METSDIETNTTVTYESSLPDAGTSYCRTLFLACNDPVRCVDFNLDKRNDASFREFSSELSYGNQHRRSFVLSFAHVSYDVKPTNDPRERSTPHVLHDVSGFVYPGEFLAVLGPSGIALANGVIGSLIKIFRCWQDDAAKHPQRPNTNDVR